MAEELHASAVFDCMVFLQGAARKNGPAGLCLSLAEAGAVRLFLSDEILTEIRDVFTRPEIQRKFPVLTENYVNEFLARINAISHHWQSVPQIFRYARDLKDEPYINLALAAEVDYLVTWDADLLDLADPSNPEGKRLRELHPKLLVVDPASFLREFGKTQRY
jgi:putative PIN family toxin of toxin-antitoxin system